MSRIGYGLLLGFVLYLLFTASGYWQAGMLVWFVTASLGVWMEQRSERPPPPGHCQRCSYDLTGNVSGRCPECGKGL